MLSSATGASPDGAAAAVSWRMHAVVGAVVASLLALSVVWVVRERFREAGAELATVATIEEHHIAAWLGARWANAGLSGSSFPQAELYQAWREEGDEVARDRLFLRLRQFAEAGAFENVALYGPGFDLLWSAEPLSFEFSSAARALWPAGAAPGSQAFLPTEWLAQGDAMVGVAAALPTAGLDTAPLVVYVIHAEDLLAHAFRDWAGTSPPTRSVVFRTSEVGVVGIAAASNADALVVEAWSLPWSRTDAPAVRLARGMLAARASAVGPDGRGATVVAAGGAVGALGWYFLVERERGAVLASVTPTVALSVVVAILVYGAAVLALARLRPRQVADAERSVRRARAERGEARALLQAVADASSDALYAKDVEGRYVLLNRAASAFVGKPLEEVLGADDMALFPGEEAAAVMANDRSVMRDRRVVTFEESVTTVAGVREFQASKGPLFDAEGRVIGLYGIARDATDLLRGRRTIEEQARALARQVEELERFNRVLVDREIAMIDLKRQVNDAMRALGRPEPFELRGVAYEEHPGA